MDVSPAELSALELVPVTESSNQQSCPFICSARDDLLLPGPASSPERKLTRHQFSPVTPDLFSMASLIEAKMLDLANQMLQ